MRLSDKMTLTRHELDEVYDNLGEQITAALNEMFEYGQEAERLRIIKLLDIWDCNNDRCDCESIDECVYRQELIALIKGEK